MNGDGVRQSAEPRLANTRVFDDANHDGVFNAGENSVLTNALGGYVLSGLSPGLHQVRVVKPAGTRVTRPSSGVYNLIVPAGVNTPARDFGITRTVKISGTVFNDVDSDGVRDAGESGLSGFKVYLDANNNGVLDAGEKNVLTDSAGSYTFNGLAAGIHRVRVQPKLFYTQTAPAAGVHSMALASGATASNRNFGEHFRPIIIDPVPLPIPLPLPLPLPRPLPIPQPIPIPIPIPDPGPLAML